MLSQSSHSFFSWIGFVNTFLDVYQVTITHSQHVWMAACFMTSLSIEGTMRYCVIVHTDEPIYQQVVINSIHRMRFSNLPWHVTHHCTTLYDMHLVDGNSCTASIEHCRTHNVPLMTYGYCASSLTRLSSSFNKKRLLSDQMSNYNINADGYTMKQIDYSDNLLILGLLTCIEPPVDNHYTCVSN